MVFNISATAGENNTMMDYNGKNHIRDGESKQIDFTFGTAGKMGYQYERSMAR
jgi:hypothetical protein